MKRSCCITGHRNIPSGQVDYVRGELRVQIDEAIKDGFTHFISGMAEGVDLLFASIVAELKADNPGRMASSGVLEGEHGSGSPGSRDQPSITLEAAIPHRKRLETKDKTFRRLIELCNSVHVTAEQYGKGTFINRNKYMVQQSERVIAVYDGREGGGTAFTVHYAKTLERELRIIEVKQ